MSLLHRRCAGLSRDCIAALMISTKSKRQEKPRYTFLAVHPYEGARGATYQFSTPSREAQRLFPV